MEQQIMFQISQKEVEAYLCKAQGDITSSEFLTTMINYFLMLYTKQQSK